MNPEILNRKGGRKIEGIPNEVLKLLNTGKIETVNLTEWLAIDHLKLIQSNFPKLEISDKIIKDIKKQIKELKKPSTMNITKLVGAILYENYKDNKKLDLILKKMMNHQSDSIRCYAPYLISLNDRLKIDEQLKEAKPLIADTHFGVREVVWMALRPELVKELKKSIQILTKWTKDKNENIRRFTTEATRPRGVWCKHIDELKENPELALSILENLKSDSSKYVQDSVGNWLNDASKSDPKFVLELCKKWKSESPTKETEKIIKRAKRTLNKK